MMKLSRIIIISVVVVAVAVIAILIWRGKNSDAAAEGDVPYKEFTIGRGQFKTSVSASGLVIPINRVEIKSEASGTVMDLPVEQGDFVEKGQLICRLDQTDARAALEQAQADYDIAEAELSQAQNTYERRKQLFEKKLISQEEYDQNYLALTQAKGKMVRVKAVLEQSKKRFDETVVKAPVAGTILQKYVEVGQIIASGTNNVSGGTTIVDIANMNFVDVEAGIDEIDVGKVGIGQSAVVTADAYPNHNFKGKIIRIAPEANVVQNVTLFNVLIEVENQDGLLKSGMNATVEITVDKEEDALLVPTLALQQGMRPGGNMVRPNPDGGNSRGGGGNIAGRDGRQGGPPNTNIRMVLLKTENGFEPHKITISKSNFEFAVAVDGLKEGDVVGVPMISRLKEQNDQMQERIRSSRSFGTSRN